MLNLTDADIGKKIREIRIKRGLTLVNVADEIGVSYQQIQKYEKATSKIAASTLFALLKLYETSFECFFQGFDINKSFESTTNTILLIENDPRDEILLQKTINEVADADVVCVHNSKQALDFLKYKTLFTNFPQPDIIFLDFCLSKGQSLDILKSIKRDKSLQKIPIIILIPTVDSKTLDELYKNGADSCIFRSFDVREFKDRIITCINYWINTVLPPPKIV